MTTRRARLAKARAATPEPRWREWQRNVRSQAMCPCWGAARPHVPCGTVLEYTQTVVQCPPCIARRMSALAGECFAAAATAVLETLAGAR